MKTIATFVVSAALASAIQINYYSDGGCSNYLVSPPNVPTDGSCYDYQFGGTNSANIANCDYNACYCIFYVNSGCVGLQEPTSVPSGSNCASNYGSGFSSFRCYTG
jgi:hypothetical protein